MEYILAIVCNYIDDGPDLLNLEQALAESPKIFPDKPFTTALFTKRLLSSLDSVKGIELKAFLNALKESRGEISGSAVLAAIIPSIKAGDYDIYVPYQTIRVQKYIMKRTNRRDLELVAGAWVSEPEPQHYTPIEEYLWKAIDKDESKLTCFTRNISYLNEMSGIHSVRTYVVQGTSFQVIAVEEAAENSTKDSEISQNKKALRETEVGRFIDQHFDLRCVKNRFDGTRLVIGYPESIQLRRLEVGPRFQNWKTPYLMIHRLMKYQTRGFQIVVSDLTDLHDYKSPMEDFGSFRLAEDKIKALKEWGVLIEWDNITRPHFLLPCSPGFHQIDWTKFRCKVEPLLC